MCTDVTPIVGISLASCKLQNQLWLDSKVRYSGHARVFSFFFFFAGIYNGYAVNFSRNHLTHNYDYEWTSNSTLIGTVVGN